MLDKYILPNDGVRSRIIDGETVVLNLKDNSFYFLNLVGARIWELANGKIKVSKIIDIIFKGFDIDHKTAQKDVINFIKELSKNKMLNLYDKPRIASKA